MTINKEEFLKYYNMGYSDVKISEVIGCSRIGACVLRRRLGLPKNDRVINHSKFMEYYNLGYTDTKIAELIGCGYQCVWLHRKKRGLSANHQNNKPIRPTMARKLPIYTIDSILEEYTPSDEDKPWTDPESLFCDGEFLEKIKSKVVEESR